MALGWGDNTWGDYGWGGAIPISGNQAAAAVGTPVFDISVALSGISALGNVDSVTFSKSVAEDSNLAIAAVGTVEASVTLALTGVSAVGLVGFGWGQGAWGDNVWGGYSVGFGNEYGITGVNATGAVGSVIVAERFIAITGVSASGAVDSVVQSVDKALTGATATGDVDTVGVANTLGLTGNEAFGQVNQIILPLNSNQALASVGTVVFDMTVELSGVGSTGDIGTMGVIRTHSLTGNLANGGAGNLVAVYWKLIDDNQSTIWQNINTS